MKEELESSAGISRFMDLEAADFDGHTEFASMSAEQRLTWLSHVARFVFLAREAVANAGLSDEASGSPDIASRV
jgi:hypothetical protein